ARIVLSLPPHSARPAGSIRQTCQRCGGWKFGCGAPLARRLTAPGPWRRRLLRSPPGLQLTKFPNQAARSASQSLSRTMGSDPAGQTECADVNTRHIARAFGFDLALTVAQLYDKPTASLKRIGTGHGLTSH